MSSQFLYNFLVLQVPNVHHVVFRSRNNPLSSRDGEVGEDAVLLILVSSVGFQTFPFGIVPQFESVVKSGGQNVFSIGRELDERYWWIVIIDQGLQTLTRCSVPDSATGTDNQAMSVTNASSVSELTIVHRNWRKR